LLQAFKLNAGRRSFQNYVMLEHRIRLL
jgi:hypothetical protein